MPNVLTAREVETLLRAGQSVPADALLTPSARDFVNDFARAGQQAAVSATSLAAARTRARRARSILRWSWCSPSRV